MEWSGRLVFAHFGKTNALPWDSSATEISHLLSELRRVQSRVRFFGFSIQDPHCIDFTTPGRNGGVSSSSSILGGGQVCKVTFSLTALLHFISDHQAALVPTEILRRKKNLFFLAFLSFSLSISLYFQLYIEGRRGKSENEVFKRCSNRKRQIPIFRTLFLFSSFQLQSSLGDFFLTYPLISPLLRIFLNIFLHMAVSVASFG